MESAWTGQEGVTTLSFDDGPGEEFYAVFEYRCFLNTSLQIIRELSYCAVSKSAFADLMKLAVYQKPPTRLDAFLDAARFYPSEPFIEAIDCLRSGSEWQVLLSALRSTLFTLYPEPENSVQAFAPPV
jgi:hypothetical protein